MKKKDFDYVLETIDCEGFDYAFAHYSNFDEIEDPEFHRLREDYLAKREALAEYIGAEDY